ncbi:MAG: DNA helicase, partial [Planctomycetes bacterium]|nr:DNA helicase [Planctomycetota bacterium]
MTPQTELDSLPRIGMVATVRNRRGVLSRVRPFDGPEGRLHLVDIEYNDGESPLEESLLWEREPFARLLPPTALPDPASSDPMQTEDLLALIRACRWSGRTPFIDPDGSGPMDRLPVTSPFHGAVQVEDYQLVP